MHHTARSGDTIHGINPAGSSISQQQRGQRGGVEIQGGKLQWGWNVKTGKYFWLQILNIIPYHTVPLVNLGLQRLDTPRKSERSENGHSCLFLKRSRDVGHHKDWGSTFLHAGVSFLSFHTLFLLHAAVWMEQMPLSVPADGGIVSPV